MSSKQRETSGRDPFAQMLRSNPMVRHYELKAIRTFLFIVMSVLFPYAILNYFWGYLLLSLLELFIAVMALILYLRIRSARYYTFISSVYLLLLGLVFLSILLYPSKETMAFAWVGVFPISSYFLLGKKWGMFAHILFSILLLAGVWWQKSSGGISPLELRELIDLAGVLIVYGFLVYLYECTKNIAYESAYRQSLIDGLTEIGNRKMFNQMLTREKLLAKRNMLPLSVIMIDLDHFKTINDRYGHLIGDEVLVGFVRLVRENLRQTDLLFRWGGEEFILLLPNESADEAYALGEKLRTAIARHSFERVGKLTASLGVTEVMPGESDDETIHRLDRALYRAKENGRNRTEKG